MTNDGTETLVDAGQLFRKSVNAIDAYFAGSVKATDVEVKLIAELTCHALLISNLIANRAGCSLTELSEMPRSRLPAIIRDLGAPAVE